MARLTVEEMNAVMCRSVLERPLKADEDPDSSMLQALQARIRAEVCRELAAWLIQQMKRSFNEQPTLDEAAAEFRARAEQEGQEGVGNEDRG